MENLKVPLIELDDFPGSLQGLKPHQITEVFPHPSLIHLEGKKKQPLFISCLLHGNEHTSFYVLQELQKYLQENELLRSIDILVGNVYAAEKNSRFLEGQSDYNRVWLHGTSPEHDWAERVKNRILHQGQTPFACVDIHNNTGANPFYACVSRLDSSSIYLGSLFSKTLVYFVSPQTTQSCVLSEYTPSVTLECGQSSNPASRKKAFQFILDLLHLDRLEHPVNKHDINVFQTVGRIEIKKGQEFDFTDDDTKLGLQLPLDFEKLNFTNLYKGERLARFLGAGQPFSVVDNDGNEVFEKYFIKQGEEVLIKKEFIPSMFTQNHSVIEQDCLGYIMESINSQI